MLDSTAISIRSVAGPRLGHRAAFWLLALTLGLLLFASSAPSPLYVVYQSSWGFSAITLTSVFAAYALALLATLITAGSLSDHVGRRPALLVALGIEMVGMLLFAEARNVEWLFAARILQGVATGVAMGAISAALLDLQPDDNPRLGALMGVAAPLSGLAAGALVSGFLVQYAPEPTRLVYWLLLGGFALAVGIAMAVPETVRGDGSWGPCHPAQGRCAQRAANAVRGGGPLPGRDLGARRPGALSGPVAHGRRPR
jgi:MFS family permease